jgi:hypothetical protein
MTCLHLGRKNTHYHNSNITNMWQAASEPVTRNVLDKTTVPSDAGVATFSSHNRWSSQVRLSEAQYGCGCAKEARRSQFSKLYHVQSARGFAIHDLTCSRDSRPHAAHMHKHKRARRTVAVPGCLTSGHTQHTLVVVRTGIKVTGSTVSITRAPVHSSKLCTLTPPS